MNAETQVLGGAMRGAGVEAFRCRAVHDVRGGVNVGVLAPAAFGRRRPRGFETWHSIATRRRVEMRSRGDFARDVHSHPREEFVVDGRLPDPAP